MSAIDVVLALCIAGALAWAIMRIRRTRKTGGCGCGCAGCTARCDQRRE